jgi:hypothetical protein
MARFACSMNGCELALPIHLMRLFDGLPGLFMWLEPARLSPGSTSRCYAKTRGPCACCAIRAQYSMWPDPAMGVRSLCCADGLVEIWPARKNRLAHRFATEPMEEGSLLWDQPCHTLVARNALGTVHTYSLREAPVHASASLPRSPLPGTLARERAFQDPSGRYLATLHPRTVVLSSLDASNAFAFS